MVLFHFWLCPVPFWYDLGTALVTLEVFMPPSHLFYSKLTPFSQPASCGEGKRSFKVAKLHLLYPAAFQLMKRFN